MDATLEARRSREHYEKYEALAKKIGIPALRRRILLVVSIEEIERALAVGWNLNTIPLALWDRLAGRIGPDYQLSWAEPFTAKVANKLSLAERVCALKHVASYYLARQPIPTSPSNKATNES